MVFMQDTVLHASCIGRWWDVILLFTGLIFGFLLTVGLTSSNDRFEPPYLSECGRMKHICTYVPLYVCLALCFLNPLRQRKRSVHFWQVALFKIILAIFVAILGITLMIYSVMQMVALGIVFDKDVCGNDLEVASILVCIVGPISSLFLLLSVSNIIYMRFVFMKPDTHDYYQHSHLIRYIKTNNGYCVPVVFYEHPTSKIVLVYSHGNAVDLGRLLKGGKLRGLRDELKVNVLSYEYAGYGHAGGASTELDLTESLRAAIDAVTSEYGYKKEHVILYGRSIGSCPTIQLACTFGPKEILGVILECPPMSILRTVRLYEKFCCDLPCDMFRSCDVIHNVKAPLFVTHGTSDTLIPISHGKTLHALAGNPYPKPYWVEGADHNNMPDVWQYRKPGRNEAKSDEEYETKIKENVIFNERNAKLREALLEFLQYCVTDANRSRRNSILLESKSNHIEMDSIAISVHEEME